MPERMNHGLVWLGDNNSIAAPFARRKDFQRFGALGHRRGYERRLGHGLGTMIKRLVDNCPIAALQPSPNMPR